MFRLDENRQPGGRGRRAAGLFLGATGSAGAILSIDWPGVWPADGYGWWVSRFRARWRGRCGPDRSLPRLRSELDGSGGLHRPPPTAAGSGARDARYSMRLRTKLGDAPIIVEDLGLITPDVAALREELGLPGMAVLQFAFDGDPAQRLFPAQLDRNSAVYTGTHDNQTTVGWFGSVPEHVRAEVRPIWARDGSDIAWDLIRAALNSPAHRDHSDAGCAAAWRQARMNTPGRPDGNWTWRMRWTDLDSGLGGRTRPA